MKPKIARIALAVAIVAFVAGGFVNGNVPELFVVATAFAAVAAVAGIRFVRIAGVVVAILSILAVVSEYRALAQGRTRALRALGHSVGAP